MGYPEEEWGVGGDECGEIECRWQRVAGCVGGALRKRKWQAEFLDHVDLLLGQTGDFRDRSKIFFRGHNGCDVWLNHTKSVISTGGGVFCRRSGEIPAFWPLPLLVLLSSAEPLQFLDSF